MRQNVKEIWNRIWKDLKLNWVGFTAVAVYLILSAFIFHNVCPMQIFFGLPCPGCGLTRAGILVLTGHFMKAWNMHPFIYAWIAFPIYLGYNRYIKNKKAPKAIPVLIVLLLSMFVFYCYRMYCYFPQVEPMNRSEHYLLKDFIQFMKEVRNTFSFINIYT